ncbi:hypothetical protein H6G64_18140 [Calothrix sp. FACHB-156]|nr:hypothetical protein [Calothrix sp. FACHB-156]
MSHFGIIYPPYPGHLNPQAGKAVQQQQKLVRQLAIEALNLKLKVRLGASFPLGTSRK